MKQGVIFDMDGVLVNTETAYLDRRLNFFREKGIQPGSENLSDYLGASNQHIWEVLVPNDLDQRRLLEKEYLQYRVKHPIDYTKVLNKGVRGLLCYLQQMDFAIALASAGELNEINRMLKECELGYYFDVVLSGETISRNKPDPMIYKMALKKLGLPASDCIVVEDSVTGIKAAKSADLETWALKPKSYRIDQSYADQVVNSLEELLQNFQRISE
ncbi:HAD family hydrolase [Pediococcus parvulus]|uniref:HAD family hydrolase n=1 Tax=Pediococcus parvulus TaxID=54062 RepID=UPI00070C45A5|nr:HAD family phosphatase [Pediococcus parvulus]MCT3026755.1 HAD family hydrolase [Pediococcus parvulus]GEL89842.1 haloacid dehalogenase [Pediococcus parvulus]GHC09072.1 haloacid dehalogenase [Pediococcus parvulus]